MKLIYKTTVILLFILLNCPAHASSLQLSKEEQAWLKENKTIRISGPQAFPPFQYIDNDGTFKGMASDYIFYIAKMVGLEVEVIKKQPWPEILKKIENKDIDVLTCAAVTSERSNFLNYSKPHLSFPLIIISRNDAPFISGLQSLHNKVIAVTRKNSTVEWLKRDKINAVFHYVNSPLEALKEVSIGNADVAVENLAAATFLIEKNGLANLKIAAPTSYGNYALSVAVRKDWPELVSIFDKGLATISPEKHNEIRQRWITVRYEHGLISLKNIIKWLWLTGGITILLLSVFYFWNRKLKKEINERRQAEEAVQASEKKYKSTLNGLLVGVVVHAKDTSVLISNPQASNILGLTYEQMSGKKAIDPAWNFVHEDSTIMKVVDYPVTKVVSTEKPLHDYVIGINRPDKDQVTWVIVNANPVFSSDSKLDKIIVNFADITANKQAEIELHESERKYKKLVKNIPGMIYRANPDWSVEISSGLETFSGYTVSELNSKEKHWLSLIHPDDIEKVFNEATALTTEQIGLSQQYRIIPKHGSVRWIEDHKTSSFSSEGEFLGVDGVAFDITERKTAENERNILIAKLHQAQKVEAIGMMAGSVAHDLNNILSGIVSYPEILLMQISEDSPLRKPLESIHQAGVNAAKVVADLLTVARGVASNKAICNLNSIADEYFRSPEFRNLKSRFPKVIFEMDCTDPVLNMICSEIHVKKALMNLVINATESVEVDGTVVIKTSNCNLEKCVINHQDLDGGNYVRLTVEDNGPGISSSDIEHIFEPFYSKKTKGFSGTGLGLAIVWNTMLDHLGAVNVVSGSWGIRFELYFPATQEFISADEDSTGGRDLFGDGERILVVDDDSQQRDIASQILRAFKYQVQTAVSGEEAVAILKEQTVDLLVLDMIMKPGISGRETYRQVIAIHPNQKAVIVSGFSDDDDVRHTLQMGASKFLQKPYAQKQLGQAVKNVLTRDFIL